MSFFFSEIIAFACSVSLFVDLELELGMLLFFDKGCMSN